MNTMEEIEVVLVLLIRVNTERMRYLHLEFVN
jgi:hypothetical protein